MVENLHVGARPGCFWDKIKTDDMYSALQIFQRLSKFCKFCYN
jgi:hypothetical protein